MEYKSINIKEKFSRFNEHWTPKVIAEMNNYQFKYPLLLMMCFANSAHPTMLITIVIYIKG